MRRRPTPDPSSRRQATAKVAESRKATSDGPQSVTAAIFWLKTKGGWRETPQTHEVGPFDLNRVTDREPEKMLELTRVAIANGSQRSRVRGQLGRCSRTPLVG